MAERHGYPDVIPALMELLNAYRNGVERLLDAPYGSIRLTGLERIVNVMEAYGKDAARAQKAGQ